MRTRKRLQFSRRQQMRAIDHVCSRMTEALQTADEHEASLNCCPFRTIPDVKDLYEEPRRWLEKVGENADLYQIKLELLKTDGKWLVKQAHLEGFKGLGFSE